jgi:iron complex transport system substrate-binding protein
MKIKSLHILAAALLLSNVACRKNKAQAEQKSHKLSKNLSFEVKNEHIDIKSGRFSYHWPEKKLPCQKIMVLSSSLLGYVSALGLEDKIVGVSSPEYVYSAKIQQNINQKKSQVVGSEGMLNVEKIMAMKPDLVLSNYQANFENQYKMLKNNGIEVLFLDEFLEEDALQKADYLLLIGHLMGSGDKAKTLLAEIKQHYAQLVTLAKTAKTQPKILYGNMYGSQWFLPTGQSFAGKFLRDANSQYPWMAEPKNSLQLTFEEVMAKAKGAQYWVNAGLGKRKQDFLQFNPVYQKLEVFQKGKMYGINQKSHDKANDFFQSGNVRADLVLQDYIKIFHPELLPNDSLVYMNEIR